MNEMISENTRFLREKYSFLFTYFCHLFKMKRLKCYLQPFYFKLLEKNKTLQSTPKKLLKPVV
jgi:hypothetical protein